jgi:hypothetical protein
MAGSWLRRFMQSRGIDPDLATPQQVAWAKFTVVFEKFTARAGSSDEALEKALAEVERRDPELLAGWTVQVRTAWGSGSALEVKERSAVDRLADLAD